MLKESWLQLDQRVNYIANELFVIGCHVLHRDGISHFAVLDRLSEFGYCEQSADNFGNFGEKWRAKLLKKTRDKLLVHNERSRAELAPIITS